MKYSFWSPKEPIQENRDNRMNFIRAGLEEIDDKKIKIRLRSIKPKPDGPRYP